MKVDAMKRLKGLKKENRRLKGAVPGSDAGQTDPQRRRSIT
jgi:hypothetical protein